LASIMIASGEYHNMTAWLDACRRPLLLTHRRPDGDALGALGGLALALRRRGLEPRVALYEPFPKRYAIMRGAAMWQDWGTARSVLEAECDAVVVLDTCALAQLGPVAEYLSRAPRTLIVDHHSTRDAIGTRPGDLRLFDVDASAVCLMVAEWAQAAGVRFEPLLATALFIGIATDCGWFRFQNTDARTLHMAAELLAAGVEADRLYAAIYHQDSPAKLRLIARMLGSLELHADGRLAVMTLRQADFAAAGAERDSTEDLVNEAGRLGCTEATILFTEEPSDIRVNFRSKRHLDVAALAAQFGGGGHARAAGARLHGPWDQEVPRVVAAAVAALQRGDTG
jgi:phosphoesterase RecJ-like protein